MATQFTTGTSPQTGSGQVWVENSNGEWEIANVTAPGIVRQVFTANGTYTPSPGMIACEVIAVGGGGGGGGVQQNGASVHTRAGGGGGGAYVRSMLTSADIGASQTVTIGAGGSGGAAGANNGSAGGNTSLGSLVVAAAGNGGVHGDPTDGGWGGAGGTAASSTGDIKIPGSYGSPGQQADVSDYWYGYMGGGASGGGFGWGAGITIWHEGDGDDAIGYGGGGGGGSEIGTTDRAGGDGSSGIIIITEYIRQSVISPIAYDSNGNEVLDLTGGTASAVNYVEIDNAATGVGPTIAAAGDDAAVPLNLASKGNEEVNLRVNNSGGRAVAFRSDEATGTGTRIRHRWYAKDSAGNDDAMAVTILNCIDNTSASEDAALDFYLLAGGSFPGTADISVRAGGISFDAGTNIMDDYEEGTWTPVFQPSSGAYGTFTYAAQEGYYVKIGSVVWVTCRIGVSTSALGSATGNALIGGLPFTVSSTGTHNPSCGVGYSNAFATNNPDGAYFTNTQTYCLLFYRSSANGGSNNLPVADPVATPYIHLFGSYQV